MGSVAEMDVDDDPAFQERLWTAMRVGWVAMLAVIVAALLGFTGKGGTFARSVVEEGEVRGIFPRVARWVTPDHVAVEVAHAAGPITIELPAEFSRVYELDRVQPQPAQVVVTPSGERYTFAALAGGGTRKIFFYVVPRAPGWSLPLGTLVVNGTALRASPVSVLP